MAKVRRRAPSKAFAWVLLLVAVVVVTSAMVVVRDHLDKAHVALTYLLLVLAGSALAGRTEGFALSIVCFFSFNFLFLPPYHTFALHNQLDWLVLFTFLATSGIATQLLYRARREADAANERAAEIDQLSALGAETLNAGRAEEALRAIAQVIQSTLGVATCEIYLLDKEQSGEPMPAARAVSADQKHAGEPASGLISVVAERGITVAERRDGATSIAEPPSGTREIEIPGGQNFRAFSIPLRVRDRTVGVLRISDPVGISLSPPQRRFFGALSYYAALGAERARLVADAERSHALREADRLKDALLASVSHDLRTPLTTIKALAHDLAGEGDDLAVTIEEEADRLNRFVADLLDLSRLDGGAVPVAPEIAAAEDLLGAAIQRVTGSLGGREVHAKIDAAEPVLVGRFDFVHSLRVLVNLIENAHKYSPPGAPIEITALREGERLMFRVEDRGRGVPAADRERIFEPFVRGERLRADRGTGLGLAIARSLAEAQSGRITYEPRPGGGSIFTLVLPAVDLEYEMSL